MAADPYAELRAQATIFPAPLVDKARNIGRPLAPASAPVPQTVDDLAPKAFQLPPTNTKQMQNMISRYQIKAAVTMRKAGMDAREMITDLQKNAANTPSRECPKTVAARLRIVAAWMVLVKSMLGEDTPDAVCWQPHALEEYAPAFLEFMLKMVMDAREGRRTLKSRTLNWWMSLFCQCIIRYTHEPDGDRIRPCGVRMLIERDIFTTLADQVVHLTDKHGLDRCYTRRLFYGLWEVSLMLTHILTNLRTAFNWRHELQRAQKLLICFYFAARPSTLGPCSEEHVKKGYALTFQAIQVFMIGPNRFAIHFNFKAFKGTFQTYYDRPTTMVLESVDRPENVLFCAVTWFLVDWIARGVFGDKIKTLDDFLACKDYERVISPEFLNEYVWEAMNPSGRSFVKGRPCMSHSFSDNIAALCIAVGLPYGGAYLFRRDAAQHYGLVVDTTTALIALHHKPGGETAVYREHYTTGAEAISWVPLRLVTEPNISEEKKAKAYDHMWRFSQAINAIVHRAQQVVGYVEHESPEAVAKAKKQTNKAANAVADQTPEVLEAHRNLLDLQTTFLGYFNIVAPKDNIEDYCMRTVREIHADAIKTKGKHTKATFKRNTPENRAAAQKLLDDINAANDAYLKLKTKKRRKTKKGVAREITDRALANEKDGTLEEREEARRFLEGPPSVFTRLILDRVDRETAEIAQAQGSGAQETADVLELGDDEEERLITEATTRTLRYVSQQAGIRKANKASAHDQAAVPSAAGPASTSTPSASTSASSTSTSTTVLISQAAGAGQPAQEDDSMPPPDEFPPIQPGRTLAGLDLSQAAVIFLRMLYTPLVDDGCRPREDVMDDDGNILFYRCRLCVPLYAHMLKHKIDGYQTPFAQTEYDKPTRISCHFRRSHNKWRMLILEVNRDDNGLACPSCPVHAPTYHKLCMHMRTRCRDRAVYQAMYQEHCDLSWRKSKKGTNGRAKGDEADEEEAWVEDEAQWEEDAEEEEEDEDRTEPPVSQLEALERGYELLTQVLDRDYGGLGAEVVKDVYTHSKALLLQAGGTIDIAPAVWRAQMARFNNSDSCLSTEVESLLDDCKHILDTVTDDTPITDLKDLLFSVRRASAIPEITAQQWHDALAHVEHMEL